MSLKVKKPNEPIIVLIVSVIALIVGLNLNFVSFRVISISLFSYKGIQIGEAVVTFGLSAIFALLSILLYYFGKNQQTINLSKYMTIIGIAPGLFGLVLIYTGYHQAKELFINDVLALDPSYTRSDVIPLANKLSPDIGVAICVGGLFLMGIAGYMLNNSNFASLTKESTLYPDAQNIPLSDDFTFENLKKLWYCPNDGSKLTAIVNRTVPNPEFRISIDRLDDNLNNAVAMRKLAPELVPYTIALSNVMLKKSKFPEIELVSTVCSACRGKYVSPKLSNWYE